MKNEINYYETCINVGFKIDWRHVATCMADLIKNFLFFCLRFCFCVVVVLSYFVLMFLFVLVLAEIIGMHPNILFFGVFSKKFPSDERMNM